MEISSSEYHTDFTQENLPNDSYKEKRNIKHTNDVTGRFDHNSSKSNSDDFASNSDDDFTKNTEYCSTDSDSDNEGSKRARYENYSDSNSTKLKEKNREHARNTRLRKKNFIDTLKQTIHDLGNERDADEVKLRAELSRIAHDSLHRKQTLQTFFFLRASGETDRQKWATILADDFYLTSPITPYRIFCPAEVVCGIRCMQGIDAVVADTASLHTMLQALATRHNDKVRMQYYCGMEDMVCTGDILMCRWVMKTENAVACGANFECFKQGMMTAVFNPQGKLQSVELIFDVMSFMQHLRRASASHAAGFQVVPNTLSLVMITNDDTPANEARIIFESSPPYKIHFASEKWRAISGIPAEDAVGMPCFFLSGPCETVGGSVDQTSNLRQGVKHRISSYAIYSHVMPDGTPKKLFIRIFPLYDDNLVTHYLALVQNAVVDM
mmetsp:Transcript_16570/g.24925  ORF Transcript_16570/g.24925 Transcript_16570/m.24925 type:complete len:439 (+) Transcript_16570:99-1415(+)|eukprot:CAMPEP_0185024794 /NCGR_PEP_ID=MMETSP1103-20130426/8005_1 /TAXON_ID=36769 /ORGANISM="Paraphysomonas bandaiensis, Strain Caron Lab Isolate" /LENGTH=438 /DNA_ID=CAMNT_0027557859 /DNA_START=80 /DNA_END=1396 /DNA_ORIENTATION=-